MDARLTVEQALGLKTGEAHIIRNAGGIVTEDALRSLIISHHLLGTQEFIIINHTDCGMLTFKDESGGLWERSSSQAKHNADRAAPFFAPVKEASIKASSSCNFPRACNSSASTRKMPSSLPSRTHCWKRRWQVWYGGYFLGSSRHCAPVPNTHKIPLSTARVSCHGRPRPSVRRWGRKIRSISSQWASLSSHRPRMPSFCPLSYTQQIAKLVQLPFMRPVLVWQAFLARVDYSVVHDDRADLAPLHSLAQQGSLG